MRPPHIHVKVHKAGYPTLTTQVYFSGNAYNDDDNILQALTPAQQALVMLNLEESTIPGELPSANWTVYISKFRGIESGDESTIATPELD
jgi:protocatechuate 3,4-dioxygenase beta subunit